MLADAVASWRHEVQIREALVRDRPAAALLAAAATAELLVVGHWHRGVLARLGSTTHAVPHHTVCSVAIVPLSP